jgi:hypothetical protein
MEGRGCRLNNRRPQIIPLFHALRHVVERETLYVHHPNAEASESLFFCPV